MTDEQQAFVSLMAAMQAEREEKATRCASDFARKCVPALAKHGVRKVVIEYSGSGDSGGLDYIEALGEGEQKIPPLSGSNSQLATMLDKESPGSSAVFDNMVNLILPAGFEINDGGQGKLTFDVVHGKWQLHHEDNVTSVTESDTDGEF